MNLLRLILGFLGDLLKRFADPEEAKKQDELRAEAKRRDALNAEAEKRIAAYREANEAAEREKQILAADEALTREALERIERKKEEMKREREQSGTKVLSDYDAVRVRFPLE